MSTTAVTSLDESRTSTRITPVGIQTAPVAAAPSELRRGTMSLSREFTPWIVKRVEWTIEDGWKDYLERFRDRPLASAAGLFWQRCKAPVSPRRLSVPLAMPSPDGSMHLAWDRDEHHVDVDLFADGTFDWFYRNRLKNEVDGTDAERAVGLPEAFARRLRLVTK